MTATERVLAAVTFVKPDRVPYWDTPWGRFVENWRCAVGAAPDEWPADRYGAEIFYPLAPDEPFFLRSRRKLRDDGDFEIRDNGWGTLVRVGKHGTFFEEHLDRQLKVPADLDRLVFDPPTLPERFTHIPDALARERQAGRCVFAKVGGIYCRSQFLRGEIELLMDMMTDEGFTRALFARVADYLTVLALETLRHTGAWDTGLWIYDDMANVNAPMFSPALFEKYLLPLYRDLLATLRQAGCRHVFFHSDGNILPLIEPLLAAGFEGFNPLEPRCGLELPVLRARFGKRFACFGGICNTRLLPRGDKREIEAHVRPLLELAKDGGIVLGCAAVSEDVDPAVYDWFRRFICENA